MRLVVWLVLSLCIKFKMSSISSFFFWFCYSTGKWETPFDPKLTREDQFIVDENTKVVDKFCISGIFHDVGFPIEGFHVKIVIVQVPVQMMNKEKRFDVYYDQAVNTSILHLPFNSSCSILLMLPNDMKELENAICPAHVTKWLKWMKPRLG